MQITLPLKSKLKMTSNSLDGIAAMPFFSIESCRGTFKLLKNCSLYPNSHTPFDLRPCGSLYAGRKAEKTWDVLQFTKKCRREKA